MRASAREVMKQSNLLSTGLGPRQQVWPSQERVRAFFVRLKNFFLRDYTFRKKTHPYISEGVIFGGRDFYCTVQGGRRPGKEWRLTPVVNDLKVSNLWSWLTLQPKLQRCSCFMNCLPCGISQREIGNRLPGIYPAWRPMGERAPCAAEKFFFSGTIHFDKKRTLILVKG